MPLSTSPGKCLQAVVRARGTGSLRTRARDHSEGRARVGRRAPCGLSGGPTLAACQRGLLSGNCVPWMGGPSGRADAAGHVVTAAASHVLRRGLCTGGTARGELLGLQWQVVVLVRVLDDSSDGAWVGSSLAQVRLVGLAGSLLARSLQAGSSLARSSHRLGGNPPSTVLPLHHHSHSITSPRLVLRVLLGVCLHAPGIVAPVGWKSDRSIRRSGESCPWCRVRVSVSQRQGGHSPCNNLFGMSNCKGSWLPLYRRCGLRC